MTFFAAAAGGARLGLTGSCDWDEEHGLGVLMDGLKIAEIGPHSTVR